MQFNDQLQIISSSLTSVIQRKCVSFKSFFFVSKIVVFFVAVAQLKKVLCVHVRLCAKRENNNGIVL